MRNPKLTWAICPCCDGHGRVENAAFSNGFTSEEWADMQSDFDDHGDSAADRYMAGTYDVPCSECMGNGKVQVPNVAAMTFAEKRVLAGERRLARWNAEWDSEAAAERRMGA